MHEPAVPRRIRLLSPQLANQIAAGEVVERPASVLKELLENSLDAGAHRIDIDTAEGGVALIRVRDDGGGIRGDDLPLALAPHATSKVYDQDELMQVSSLGFRGEALASIASVSRLVLTTRTADEPHGWRLVAGVEPVPDAHPQGTTVEVRDLFYNTPARRKFLRAERTECDHLVEVVRRTALSRFDVALTLRHNQRQLLQLPAVGTGQRVRRLGAVCGKGFAEHAWALDFAAAGMRLSGWIARPDAARAQADLQYFFINGRAIRDRVVTHAVRQAYGEQLYPGRHPAYVLYLEMDPSQVDVNVHPTKHEVRFREARRVHDFLFRVLREAVVDGPVLTPHMAAVEESASGYVTAPMPAVAAETSPGRRILGLLHGRYLLLEEPRGLRLVDVAAVRAARAAATMREALARDGAVRGQPLLLPVTLPVERAALDRLIAAAAPVAALGFEIDRIGPGQLVVRQVPAALRHVAVPLLLETLVTGLAGLEGEVTATALVDMLLPLAGEGTVPERAEWDGIAAVGMDAGASVVLSLDELERLLRQSRR